MKPVSLKKNAQLSMLLDGIIANKDTVKHGV
jgi:hypothetical protein